MTKPHPVTRAPRLAAVIIAAIIVAMGATHPAIISSAISSYTSTLLERMIHIGSGDRSGHGVGADVPLKFFAVALGQLGLLLGRRFLFEIEKPVALFGKHM